jgi:hypothetical protein
MSVTHVDTAAAAVASHSNPSWPHQTFHANNPS